MTRFVNLLLVGSILCTLNSCGSEPKKEIQKELDEKNRLLKDSIKKSELNQFCKAENATLEFNDAEYQITLFYELLLEQNTRTIINDYWIRDIKSNGEDFDVTIQCGFVSIKFIKFTCTFNQLENICPEILNINNFIFHVQDKYLALEITSIKKLEYQLEPFEGTGIVYGALAEPAMFLCTGKLINFR
jgi:hypothetical protein